MKLKELGGLKTKAKKIPAIIPEIKNLKNNSFFILPAISSHKAE